MTPEVETATAAEVETSEAQPLPASTSLSEHRAEFPGAPKRGEAPVPEPEAERPRHRAKSQTAGPDDVKQIDDHTKRLRAAEDKFIADAGLKIEQKAGESDRVFNIRRRAEIAEARLTTKPTSEATPDAAVKQPPAAPQTSPSTFEEKRPTQDQFMGETDPYAALILATAAWQNRKDSFEARQTTTQTSATAQRDQWVKDVQEKAHTRLMAHMASNPADKALFEAEASKPHDQIMKLTPIMRTAIDMHGQGPSFVIELLKHPDFADELFMLTNGQFAFDSEGQLNPAVATLQRRLLARVQAVPTGAAVPQRPVKVAPRPPTPVRTVPQTPSEKPPSGESTSLREHRSAFPSRR